MSPFFASSIFDTFFTFVFGFPITSPSTSFDIFSAVKIISTNLINIGICLKYIIKFFGIA